MIGSLNQKAQIVLESKDINPEHAKLKVSLNTVTITNLGAPESTLIEG